MDGNTYFARNHGGSSGTGEKGQGLQHPGTSVVGVSCGRAMTVRPSGEWRARLTIGIAHFADLFLPVGVLELRSYPI